MGKNCPCRFDLGCISDLRILILHESIICFYFVVQECWCDRAGSLREGSESVGDTEKKYGSVRIPSECCLY